MTDAKFKEEVIAKTNVLNAIKMQESFWKDRARVKWLIDGDRNSSYFHAYAKVRSASARMSAIHDGHSLLTDPSDIANHVVGFYQNLYSMHTSATNLEEVCSVILPIVTEEENALLLKILTADEVRSAVFHMDAYSAPGPDGFSGSFYQACWILWVMMW